jgi:hypothetical protein
MSQGESYGKHIGIKKEFMGINKETKEKSILEQRHLWKFHCWRIKEKKKKITFEPNESRRLNNKV